MIRTDDINNMVGHRLSTGAIKEVLTSHPDLAKCTLVEVADTIREDIPAGFIVLKAGVTRPNDTIIQELIPTVREKIGPVASLFDGDDCAAPTQDTSRQDITWNHQEDC